MQGKKNNNSGGKKNNNNNAAHLDPKFMSIGNLLSFFHPILWPNE